MPLLELSLVQLFLDQLLLPQFDSASTFIRKQVVLTLAELKLTMDVRLLTQSQLLETSFDKLVESKLLPGRLKLVLIYYDRLLKDLERLNS